MDPLVIPLHGDFIDAVPDQAADHRLVRRFDCASSDSRGDLRARSWSELVSGMQRHERHAMAQGTNRAHFVEGRGFAAMPSQHGNVDMIRQWAFCVRLDACTWPAMGVVA
jgi:hypothetical protein